MSKGNRTCGEAELAARLEARIAEIGAADGAAGGAPDGAAGGTTDGAEKSRRMLSYMDMILQRNEQINLTAITDRQEFFEKHLLDSLSCAELPEFSRSARIIDVGTGGGFPGVPLAIAFPEKEFLLVDSLRKRLLVVEEFCRKLGVDNAALAHGRAEELGRQEGLRDGFDLCVSRAVANLPVLCELCLPFVKPGGAFLAYKGAGAEEEAAAAERAIRLLGGRLSRIERVSSGGATPGRGGDGGVPDSDRDGGTDGADGGADGAGTMTEHRLVVVEKVAATPAAYPRRPGQPARKPL